ncbi:response regulator [Pedobacter sp. GR22-6]|uniref:response regulator n=1 Tax=Pedobacter sp. GR22-6 TaxID=3127957 RepID=UPI00307D990C
MAKKILVIDDDKDILSILDIIFGDEGYERVLCNTGISTEHIKILDPDLILLDVRIVGFPKTGAQICAEIKKERDLESIPVLLVSAELNVPELAQSCGANGYVNKPFDIDKLVKKVKEFIN